MKSWHLGDGWTLSPACCLEAGDKVARQGRTDVVASVSPTQGNPDQVTIAYVGIAKTVVYALTDWVKVVWQ